MRVEWRGLLTVCLLSALATGNSWAGPTLPNIIYIYADDLGYGELGSYGQTKIRTPVLDRLADGGMRFTQHYSGSTVCAPSRCALLTGRHTGHAYIRNTAYEAGTVYQLPLPDKETTLAEVMKQAGYATGVIGKWSLGGPDNAGHPNRQGFDYFFGFLNQDNAHWHYPRYLWRNGEKVMYPENNGILGPRNNGKTHAQDEMTREALSFIADNADHPFFLYLAYTLPHVSLQPPPHSDPAQAALGKTAVDEFYSDVTWKEPNAKYPGDGYHTGSAAPRRSYAAMITAMDRDIGRILDRLDELGLTDDTLVLFSSDNGPTFVGGVDYKFFNSTGGLQGLKSNLYEGGIRVPMIARWPNRIPAGTVSDHVSAQWDVLPTLAELAGVPHPSNTDGLSFLPTLLGRPEDQEQHPSLYWEYGWGHRAVRMGRWKGVRIGGPPVVGGRLELYDLLTDPGETVDVAASHRKIVSQMHREMDLSHSLSNPFFRYWDEFSNYSCVYFLPAYLGFEMTAILPFTLGEYAIKPLPEAVDQDIHFRLNVQMKKANYKYLSGGLLFGNGPKPENMVVVGMRGSQSRYVIERGTQRASLPFPAGTNPLRVFKLEVKYSPTTGIVQLREGGQTLTTLTLDPPLRRISHVGYGIANSRTFFSPIVVTLPTDPSVELLTPTIENGQLRTTYLRPQPDSSSVFQYQCSNDLETWIPCLPHLEQPVDLFGRCQRVDVRFGDTSTQPVFYRVQRLEPVP